MSDPKPFRPAWRAVDHVPADLPTVDLLAHVEQLEAQIAKLAAMVVPATPETRVRVKLYGLIEDAIQRGIRYGCVRAYKHREGSLPEDVAAAIANHGTDCAMLYLAEFLDIDAWEEGDDGRN